MPDLDAATGGDIDGLDHLGQSISLLLATALGERVMREWVGNPGTRLLGENITERTITVWISVVWMLIELFEPRFKITRFVVDDLTRTGTAAFTMLGQYRPYAALDFQQAKLFISINGGDVRVQAAG